MLFWARVRKERRIERRKIKRPDANEQS